MNRSIDFDRYWGVRLSGISFDCNAMSIALDVHWTIGPEAHIASLRFNGVSRCEFDAGKIFDSEVVELISLSGEKVRGGWRVVGEMSNYEFVILCASIEEE
ncbi:hypothetical protein [Fulvimonas soli]|uniref:hypothetical protein n=1 Tax=Fulvimonas soli TaxID=155197 RepID=UPI001120803B|nr:hypothetical protein [Fulvimonas soli]